MAMPRPPQRVPLPLVEPVAVAQERHRPAELGDGFLETTRLVEDPPEYPGISAVVRVLPCHFPGEAFGFDHLAGVCKVECPLGNPVQFQLPDLPRLVRTGGKSDIEEGPGTRLVALLCLAIPKRYVAGEFLRAGGRSPAAPQELRKEDQRRPPAPAALARPSRSAAGRRPPGMSE